MTYADRCKLATDCLPPAEYRRRLEALHCEMLGEIDRLRAERERLRSLVKDVRDANAAASGDTFHLLTEAQQQAWDRLMAALGE